MEFSERTAESFLGRNRVVLRVYAYRGNAWWRTQSNTKLSPLSNSLLTGKLVGNFDGSSHRGEFQRPVVQRIQLLGAKFPTQRSRDFFERMGNLSAGTGNSDRETTPSYFRMRLSEGTTTLVRRSSCQVLIVPALTRQEIGVGPIINRPTEPNFNLLAHQLCTRRPRNAGRRLRPPFARRDDGHSDDAGCHRTRGQARPESRQFRWRQA